MCIEHATVLRANIMRVMCEYKVGEGVPRYSRFDKLMSGSSLEGKAFFTVCKNRGDLVTCGEMM